MITRQRAAVPVLGRYPFPDHTDVLLTGSRARRGKRQYKCRPLDGYARRSAGVPKRCISTRELEMNNRGYDDALTCWLMSTMAISLRSLVNLSKAPSIVASSVLASTTRKFFCESGAEVTCLAEDQQAERRLLDGLGRWLTPTPARRSPVQESCSSG